MFKDGIVLTPPLRSNALRMMNGPSFFLIYRLLSLLAFKVGFNF